VVLPLMAAALTAATIVATGVAATARGHVAATATATIATAEDRQEILGLGLRRNTHQTDRQHGGNQTALHWEAPQN
jgi:hypothetical protein